MPLPPVVVPTGSQFPGPYGPVNHLPQPPPPSPAPSVAASQSASAPSESMSFRIDPQRIGFGVSHTIRPTVSPAITNAAPEPQVPKSIYTRTRSMPQKVKAKAPVYVPPASADKEKKIKIRQTSVPDTELIPPAGWLTITRPDDSSWSYPIKEAYPGNWVSAHQIMFDKSPANTHFQAA